MSGPGLDVEDACRASFGNVRRASVAQYRRMLVAAHRSSVPVLLKQVAIAIAGAVREAASRRERPQLWDKSLPGRE